MKNLCKLFMISCLTFWGCEKETLQKQNDETTSDLIPSRLIFNSQADFDQAIETLKKGESLKLPANFISLDASREIVSGEALLKSGQTTEEDTLIASDYFRSLLNANREIQVGDFIYKITESATFYTQKENYSELLKYLDKPFDSSDCRLINESQLKSTSAIESNRYESISNPEIKMVDTYRIIDPDVFEPDFGIGVSSSGSSGGSSGSSSAILEPKDSDFIVSSYKGTVVGKWWDDLWGFAISIRHYFDSRNRMDAKFYAQDFAVYSEAGIKTKTQYKGWTGIWRKKDCDEISSGYEVMILTQEWSKNIVPSPVDPASKWPYNTPAPNTLKTDYGDLSFVGRGDSYFKNKTYDTFSFIGKDIDLTKKDVLNAVYKALLASQSMLPDESKEEIFRDKTAIQLIDPWQSLRKSTFVGLNHEKIGKNTDKVTYIIEKDWGFQIGYSASLDNILSWSNF